MVWDGSVLFIGAILLVLGVRRWISDAKQTRPPVQDPYQHGYPQQPAPWGDYPGRQTPGPQDNPPPNDPPQGQPPNYLQQPGGTFPG